jgi:predicted TIM-barrel fold metal-dependent hydrolase
VVAAHWGGMGCTQAVLDRLCGENLYFDLSFGYGVIPKKQAQLIVEKHTPDRLLFGSDLPWHRPQWEKRLLDTLELSQADIEKICCGNARRLLNI